MSEKVKHKAAFLMKYGTASHQEKVLKRSIKATSVVRWNSAINGKKEHLDILVHDKDPEVRSAVACQGYKDHLDKLVNDKDAGVRMKVAMHGDESHHEKLLNDPDIGVRREVVNRTSSQHHLKVMANDLEARIRNTATSRMNRISDFLDKHGDDPLLKK